MKIRHHHAAVAFVAASLAQGALAETGPYYIGGLVSYTHQSNVWGLGEGQALRPELGQKSKADNVTSLALIGGLNQTIGRQRVFGDATLRNNRYADNAILKNNSYALSGGVDWETVENISGNLTFKTNRDLFRYSPFDPFDQQKVQQDPVKNLVTSRQADAAVRVGGITVLTFEGGAGYRSVDYSDSAFDSRDNHQTYWLLGTRFAPTRGAYVGLNWRDTSGKYPRFRKDKADNPIEDSFDRRDISLVGYLELSGLTNVYARISNTKVDYELQRDFSGSTAQVKVTWLPTAKLKVGGELARDRGQDLRFVTDTKSEAVESPDLATALRFRADYEVTGKVIANLTLGYTRQPFVVAGTQQEGRYITRQWGLGASWEPTRTSRVGCDLSRERSRTALDGSLNSSSNSLGCYAQLTLQP